MNNLFDRDSVHEILDRIDKLQSTARPNWGKMNVAQMLAHCSACMDMATGQLNLPRSFIGRILGPIAKPIYTNEKPLSKNSPTARELVCANADDFAREQEQLRAKVQQFFAGGEAKCTRHPHPFFGPLTPQEWSRGSYKHLDHHLRQFGV